MTRLRFLARINPATREFDAVDGVLDVTFVPLEDVWPPPRWAPKKLRPRSDVSSGYTRFLSGDILVPKITPTFEAGRSVVATDLPTPIAAGTTELHVVRSGQIDPRYLNYCFQSKPFLDGGRAAMVGVAGQKRVPEAWLMDYRLPIRDPGRQGHIADLLDVETGRIDAILEKKRSMMTLLLERLRTTRLRVINNAPDQRIERLKYLARMETGHTPDKQVPAYWQNCTIPWVTLNDVAKLEDGDTFVTPLNCINELGLANSSARVLPERTVILSRDATVGRTALLGEPMAISQHFVGWICGPRLLPEYLVEVLRGPFQPVFESLSFGSTIATIGVPELRDLAIPVPNLDDQRAVVVKIQRLRESVHRATQLIASQIDLLRERRQTLITAAVTGQLDVAAATA